MFLLRRLISRVTPQYAMPFSRAQALAKGTVSLVVLELGTSSGEDLTAFEDTSSVILGSFLTSLTFSSDIDDHDSGSIMRPAAHKD